MHFYGTAGGRVGLTTQGLKMDVHRQVEFVQLAACATGGWIADIIRFYVNKLYFVFISDLFD